MRAESSALPKVIRLWGGDHSRWLMARYATFFTIPTRPVVVTLNTVSNGSKPDRPVSVRNPLPWLKLTAAPVRRLVTLDTTYPLSRTRTVPLVGGSTTWMYCSLGSTLRRSPSTCLTVVNPYAPLPNEPPLRPPYMYPPPWVLSSALQIGLTQLLKKELKLRCCDGKSPLTMAVSAMRDFIDDPALARKRPMVSLRSTLESPPLNHQLPLVGSL